MNLIETILSWNPLRRFLDSERGVAATEFALTIPVWAALLVGTADGAYCLIVNERVDRIAYTVTNIVTQQQSVTTAGLNNIALAAGELMQPFPFGANGVVIVTSIFKPVGQPPAITWQYTGGGSLGRTSRIGLPGNPSLAMPNGLTLNDNENVIVSEVYYVFTPMFGDAGILSPGDVYRAAIYKPRLSQLTTPPT